MNSNPSAKQKRFHNWCREHGCMVCREETAIHHIKGSKMKLKGCVKPGEYYILPLCYYHHQGLGGVHTDKRLFVSRHGTEKDLWRDLIDIYEKQYDEKPCSELTYLSIIVRA